MRSVNNNDLAHDSYLLLFENSRCRLIYFVICCDISFNALNGAFGSFYGIGKSTLNLKQTHLSRN